MANWVFGSDQLDFGPCNVYWDTATGGANLFLGGVDSVVIRASHEKTDLNYSQYGSTAADRGVTGTTMEVELGLTNATEERVKAMIQGIHIVKDGSNNITNVTFAVPLGQRDSDIWKQVKIVRVYGGAESTAPQDTLRIWRAAPSGSIERTFDAASQSIIKVTLTCYADPNHLDALGRPTFWGINYA
jgi:hypothetical protein